MTPIWLTVDWTRPACAGYDQSKSNSSLSRPWHWAASCPTWAPPRWREATTPAPCAPWAAPASRPRLLRARLGRLQGTACFLLRGRDTYHENNLSRRYQNWESRCWKKFGRFLRLSANDASPILRDDLWLDGALGASLWCHTPQPDCRPTSHQPRFNRNYAGIEMFSQYLTLQTDCPFDTGSTAKYFLLDAWMNAIDETWGWCILWMKYWQH